ncbi:RHS repeat domain-containing protein [Poritiphilus flavus]|uniref:YD repeat-containing protein n=1 Tax=Poritiphilus flavus TaxID=2697053 RepID=A0A6L9ECB3_9FLAO|nr:RHS repeat domain-containing protein [Poritiphilus flavus]NAS12394.1 hypothetical protein [Poritiphilus flavus]
MLKIKIHRIILFSMFNVFCYGQELPKILPSNPEAAAMGKFGDIPVGTFTGVPNISIPIMELSCKSYSVPISLQYHASGIRVNEIASRVGLGWKLNAGGSITRSVRGIPDDYVTGYLSPVVTVSQFLSSTDVAKANWITNFSSEYDFESDIYYYNVPGHSGKFFFKQSVIQSGNQNENPKYEIVTHPKDDVKIDYWTEGTKITRWEITAANGTKYYLGKSKDSTRQARDLSTTYSTNGSTWPDPPQALEDYVTSWHLMDVEAVDQSLTSFTYDFSNITFYNISGQQKEIPKLAGTSSNPIRTSYAFNKDKVHRLTSIINNRGSILFGYNHSRTDLKQDFALTDITLKDLNNKTIDNYALKYGYFTSTKTHNSNFGNLDQRRKRLYLQNVKQTLENVDNKVYSFEYDTSQILPDRFSFSQDFWGYYNGQDNSVFYPKIEWNAGVNNVYTTIAGADRKVYETYAKACSLKKITYPTGGYTEFDFESNKIGNIDFFGLTETKQVTIDGLSSVNSSDTTFEKYITVADPDQYIGGINWTVNMNSCANSGGLDCPKAELYKKIGTQFELIAATNGSSLTQGIVFTEGVPLELKIILYNNSGIFPPEPRVDISAFITGRELIPNSQNGVTSGGLRLKTIKNYDHDGTQLLSKEYIYTKFDDSSTTSGAALNPPTFIYKNMFYCEGGATGGPVDLLQSNSIFPLTNGSSYTSAYSNVTEILDNGNAGKIEYTHHFMYDGAGVQTNTFATGLLEQNINTPLQDFAHRRGLLLNKKVYAKSGSAYNLIEETSNSYNPLGENLLEQYVSVENRGCFGGYSPYKNLSERFYLTQTTTKRYHSTGNVTEIIVYTHDLGYSGRTFPIEVSHTDSMGNSKTTRTYYADDKSQMTGLSTVALSAIDKLKDANRITEPLQTTITLKDSNEVVLSKETQQNAYRDWGNSIPLSEFQRTSKATQNLEDRIQYHSYYSNGNPKEISVKSGPHIVYIWGYKGEYPIARIENAIYTDVSSYVSNLQTLSLADTDNCKQSSCKEELLRQGLNALRTNLPKAMVTTYTYDPLVGVTSITDPRGNTTYYSYDDFNRLKEVRDADKKLVSDYQYHYKSQIQN